MTKISIAMTTYNGEKYLNEQLDSFMTQTHRPDELIVVDDCSIDNTLNILNKFKKDSPFPVIILSNKENIGKKRKYAFAKNFEKAINNCSGDIIFLSDQDDVWFPEKISRHVDIYKNNSKVIMVSNDALRTNSNLFNYNLTQIDYGRIEWGMGRVSIGCCFSFKRESLNNMLPIPNNISHDVWFYNYVNYILNGRNDIEEPLQYFRRSRFAWSAINEGSESITVLQCYFCRFRRYLNYMISDNNTMHISNFIEVYKELLNRLYRNFDYYIINYSFTKNELLEKANLLKKTLCLLKKRQQIVSKSNCFSRIKPILRLYKSCDLYSKSSALKDLLSNLYPFHRDFIEKEK